MAGRIPALVMAKGGEEASASQTIVVGDAPEAFGQGFTWGREDNQALLAVYLSASDAAGVTIEGLQASDRIVVTFATGLASFAEDDESLERGLIGLIASGASVAAGLAGYPGAIPFIKKAEEFAQERYRPKDIHTKVRDAFGADPANGFLALQEGGVLVTLPEAGTTYTSGTSENRWIKGKLLPQVIDAWEGLAYPDSGARVPENYPDHVKGAFFLRQEEAGSQTPHTTFVNGGVAALKAWDYKFGDNAGYYKIHVRLEKGKPDNIDDVERLLTRSLLHDHQRLVQDHRRGSMLRVGDREGAPQEAAADLGQEEDAAQPENADY